MVCFGLPLSYDDAGSEPTSPSLPIDAPKAPPTMELPVHALSEGVTTDFKMSPHIIPIKEDGLLMKSDQALLMNYHKNLVIACSTTLKN